MLFRRKDTRNLIVFLRSFIKLFQFIVLIRATKNTGHMQILPKGVILLEIQIFVINSRWKSLLFSFMQKNGKK